ncbi:hemerythrin domain-containing protein [Streptomyces sp. NPDC101234]|uniref:hemerythrin domain-containing protein n=1 Tax=Streptomyces sp. NPDC101234 TaxID=3366138 RepID=UPI00381B0FE2
MTMDTLGDPMAVVETRLAHDVHRAATSLLAEAAANRSVPLGALTRLRDFLVANIRHHHETEDGDLWPQILAVAPSAARALDVLSEEHERLDSALDALDAVVMNEGDSGAADQVRDALRAAAVEVRDTVHDHLTHEEPFLLPALRDHISPAAWEDFSQRVIATTPPVGGHLMIGFLDEVGKPDDVETMLAALPEPVRPLLPAMRLQAAQDLRVLRGTGS